MTQIRRSCVIAGFGGFLPSEGVCWEGVQSGAWSSLNIPRAVSCGGTGSAGQCLSVPPAAGQPWGCPLDPLSPQGHPSAPSSSWQLHALGFGAPCPGARIGIRLRGPCLGAGCGGPWGLHKALLVGPPGSGLGMHKRRCVCVTVWGFPAGKCWFFQRQGWAGTQPLSVPSRGAE